MPTLEITWVIVIPVHSHRIIVWHQSVAWWVCQVIVLPLSIPISYEKKEQRTFRHDVENAFLDLKNLT